jgi:hypothetical protein
MAAIAGTTSVPVARADEAQAKALFKTMSDYLAAQQAISFDYDSTLEVVTDKDQKLGLANSGTVTSIGLTSSTQRAPADLPISSWCLTEKR